MDRQLAERMVGAACLLAILVLVVPAVLDGNGDPEPGRLAPSGESSVDLRTHTIRLQEGDREPPVPVPKLPPHSSAPTPGPLTVDEPSLPAAVSPSLPAEKPDPPAAAVSPPQDAGAGAPAPSAAPQPAVVPLSPPPPPPPPPRPALTPTPSPPTAGAPSPAAGGWFVQLGSFAQRANAERLAGELRAKGFSSLVVPGGGSSGGLFRVRAGPVGDRTTAEELAARLGRAGYPGQVVR